jgi:antitoxin (DNA-binding transcriptional repressor) of toxin-antitoxin stability system
MPGVEGQGQVNDDGVAIYTSRQLNQQTAEVMAWIEKNGPALITRHGRFVATISPLGRDIESRVLSEIAGEIGKQGPAASSQVSDDKTDVYTIRQVGQHTADVIAQIEKNGPALITRHGHFVAIISPVRGDVASRVLGEIARELGKQGPAASA